MSGPLIELRAVTRTYDTGGIEVRALDGIDLRIEAGEFIAIVGQSGSGKSTLMNLLGCLDVPSSGQFLLDGQETNGLAPDRLALLRRMRFGFIFQRYHLLGHLDALENVALPAIYAGMPRLARQQRAADLLGRMGLQERLHHRPSELSGGQQQRVSIARALMNGGQIVLADEPTGALDSQAGAAMLDTLQALNEQGHTIIVVTHDAAGVAARARRVIELSDGRIVRDTVGAGAHDAVAPAVPAPALDGARRTLALVREALMSAVQALLGHRLRSALSMLGICIGITAVVSIVALTGAVQSAIDHEIGSLLGARLNVWSGNAKLPPNAQPRLFRTSELDALRALPGVTAVAIDMKGEMQARRGARDGNIKVHGAADTTMSFNRLRLVEGSAIRPFDFEHGALVVMIDGKVREQFFAAGEPVLGRTLLIAQPGVQAGAAEAGAAGVAPAGRVVRASAADLAVPVTVVGVFEAMAGSNFGRETMGEVLLPHAAFRSHLDTRPDVREFSVFMERGSDPALVQRRVVQRLIALHGAEDFDSWNGASSVESLKTVLAVAGVLLGGVAAIALVVGGVGIMNIMLVSVTERTREIGIRMAVGARQADIRLQFLIESAVLCGAGGLCGLLLCGVGALIANASQERLVFAIDATALLVAVGVSSLIGILFGTLPARRAAALSPVDALARE